VSKKPGVKNGKVRGKKIKGLCDAVGEKENGVLTHGEKDLGR